MQTFTNDIFDPEVGFHLEEAKGEVDGKHVLAKISGQFFVMNGESRNRRFYPRELWEKQLANKEVQDLLKTRRMFGTIGHDQKIDDRSLAEGRVSHIVTVLEERGGMGYGEALILNTPYGQTLNTIYRAGAKLFISSRAKGSFSGDQNGVPRVNPESYKLESFDFVLDPGFLDANPDLAESYNELIKNNTNESEENMSGIDPKLLEQLSRENITLRTDLERVLADNKKLQESFDKSSVELTETKARLDRDEEKTEVLAQYKVFGSPAEIQEAYDKAEGYIGKCRDTIRGFESIGTQEQIQESIDKAGALLAEYKRLGSPEQIQEAFTKAEEAVKGYHVVGTPEKIEEAFDKAEELLTEYRDLGTPEQIKEAMEKGKELIEKYLTIGSPEEISEVYTRVEGMVESVKTERTTAKIKSLSNAIKVPVSAIEKVYDRMTEAEMHEFFGSVKGSAKIQEKYRKPEPTAAEKINESHDDKSPFNVPRAKRLMGSFT